MQCTGNVPEFAPLLRCIFKCNAAFYITKYVSQPYSYSFSENHEEQKLVCLKIRLGDHAARMGNMRNAHKNFGWKI
jgi:hypothetical protein